MQIQYIAKNIGKKFKQKPLLLLLFILMDQQELQEAEGNANYQEIGIIRTKSGEDERVNINMNFFGLDLSKIPQQNLGDWTVYIIPVH